MPAVGSSSRTPLIIAIVVFALGGLALLNQFQYQNDPKVQEKMEQERAREEAKKASDQQKDKPAAAPGRPGPEQQLASFGAEKVLGDPNGSQTVTVGWRWTPAVQGDPSKVYATITALEQAAPKAKIRVVNLDAEPGAVPEGIGFAGKSLMPLTPDGALPPAQAVGPAIGSALGGGPGAGAPPGPPPGAAAPPQ